MVENLDVMIQGKRVRDLKAQTPRSLVEVEIHQRLMVKVEVHQRLMVEVQQGLMGGQA